jgi:acyl-CoA dehydrogenase
MRVAPPVPSESALLRSAEVLSREILAPHAADVDQSASFPDHGLSALKAAGLMAFFVPDNLGGQSGTISGYSRICAALAEGCVSTAMIWAMHGQQVGCLAHHACNSHADMLRQIATDGWLVGSVTSEYGKGGSLLIADAALVPEQGGFRVRRRAPYVTGGDRANLFLVTMRTGNDRPANDVTLVSVTPRDGNLRVTGQWNTMGMRGTHSVPMEFDMLVPEKRILSTPFRTIAVQTMIPVGHIGWASCWYGAARGAVNRVVAELRLKGSKKQRNLSSDLLLTRLADIRVSLDLLEGMIANASSSLDRLRSEKAPAEAYADTKLTIMINNVKLAGSTLAFSILDRLIEIAGLGTGYSRGSDTGLERIFRDLRSAPLMYANDRLLEANGKLILTERGRIFDAFESQD